MQVESTRPRDRDEMEDKQLAHLEEIKKTQGWYDIDSGTHDRLRRLSLELVSERPATVPKVCQALVQALAEGMKRSQPGGKKGAIVWERDPRGESINLGGEVYENRVALKEYCQNILRRYVNEQPLDEKDLQLMQRVLANHPRGTEKLHGCQAMVVGMHPVHKARCFYVIRHNGREDFSFLRCVQNTPTDEIEAQRQICDALCKVLQLHPTSCEHVAQVIESNFPSYRGKEGAVVEKHRNWTHNILELCSRMPALTDFLLRVLVRRMVEIDAAMTKMEEDVAPEEAYGAGIAQKNIEQASKPGVLESMAGILDAQMMMLFEFLQRHLSGTVTDAEHQLVSALFGIFESTVLLTHRARCVPFLWFYLVSLRPAWTEAFLSLLLHTAFSPCIAIPKRLISLAYLASFIARAKFLTKNFTLRTAQYVSTLAREHLQVAESHVVAGDRVHPQLLLFLYAVQAFCYMTCFHTAEFAAPEPGDTSGRTALSTLLFEGAADVGAEAFGPVLESPSNPIARINKQVAEQFCHCLSDHNPALVVALKQRLLEFAGQVPTHFSQGDEAGLDIFFPFDPYRLRHSSMFVQPIYRDWNEDDESNADPGEGFAAKAAVAQMPNGRSRASSDGADSDRASDVDFTDARDAVERGFLPSVGPSPAFRPRGSTDMADIMSPLCMPMESAYEDCDDFALPSATVPMDAASSSLLFGLMNSAAYREGREGRVR